MHKRIISRIGLHNLVTTTLYAERTRKMAKTDWFEAHTQSCPDEPCKTVRLVHTIKIDFSKRLENVDEIVNTEALKLAKKGCKIISIQSKQVGFQPVYLFYDITYEPNEETTKLLLQ